MTFAHHGLAVALLAAGIGALGGNRATAPLTAHSRSTVSADDDTTLLSYTVDSVRVIQRLLPATEVVAVNIYLLGGSRQLTPATQGIEAMMLDASKYGTRAHPDSSFRLAWGMTGSALESDIGSDWSMLGFRTVQSEFDDSWNLVCERLTQATFRSEAVKTSRERMLGSLLRRRGSPEGQIGLVVDSVAFAGHAYGLSPFGTESSLSAIDSAALVRYAREQVVRSRMLVVVVGSPTRAMVEAAVKRTLGSLPAGSYKWTPPAPAPPHKSSLTLLPRSAATNYVIGVFDGPPETSDDFPSFRAATNYLGEMITSVVREKRGLSYAASASVSDRALVTGVIYVSTGKPDTVVRMVQQQIRTLTNPDSMPAGFSFTADKNSLTYLFRRSTAASQVDALAHAELLQGDYRLADNVPRRLRTVSTGSMRRAAVNYMKNIRFIYAGDTTLVKRTTFTGKN